MTTSLDVRQPLAPRHRRTLELIADGHTSAEAATLMGCSKLTIDCYVQDIMWRLDARSRTHAVAIAFRTGLLSVDPEPRL